MDYVARCVYADKLPDVFLAQRRYDLHEGGSCYRPPESKIWYVWHTPEHYDERTGKQAPGEKPSAGTDPDAFITHDTNTTGSQNEDNNYDQ